MESRLKATQILVIDKDDLVRQGIRLVLEQEGATVAEADSVEQAVELVSDPDVTIVDPLIVKDRCTGDKMVIDLIHRFPTSRVLVCSEFKSLDEISHCFELGAHGYLLKSSPPKEMVEAVHRMVEGNPYLQPSLGAALLKTRSKADRELTPKECNVLRMLALGYTNAEAASILCYSARTVEGYKARIMRKLSINTRAELVRAAAELKLLNFEDQP